MTASDYSSGPYTYSVATRADEATVRDILARTPMGGNMRLALCREPDAFATDACSHAHGYVIAREQGSGKLVGLCERLVREMFVNGEISRVPYLAALRVLPEFRHRVRAIRGGFEAVRRLLVQPGDLPFALTAIMSDNLGARRLLGKGLPGMPLYELAGELSTFALRASARRDACERATSDDLPEISELLMHTAARTQFANAWRPEALRGLEHSGLLRAQDYLLIRSVGRIRACAALWDQSRFRQVVVAGYSPWLHRLRPAINVAARLLRQPSLPAPGQTLRVAYVSHIGLRDEDGDDLRTLLDGVRAEAHKRGIDSVLCGWATQHALTRDLRDQAGTREYRSQLYLVRWPEDVAPVLDAGRRLAPEIALL